MSFVRINRKPVRTKKVAASKKEWVSTVHDLAVYRSTAEELSRRRDVHRSRNRAAAHYELREKSPRKRKPWETSPRGLDQTRLRLFREVFSDHCELRDVLARSDRALTVVKDLFGDAPRRQKGFPSVTMAPDCESDSGLPVLQKPDPPTQLSLLSQSMMDQQALNEVDDSAAEHGEDLRDVSVSFNSETCRLKRKTCKSKAPVWGTAPQPQQQNVPQTPCNTTSSENHAALNATVAVQRIKSRQSQSEADQSTALINQVLNPEPSSFHSGGQSRSFKTTRGRSPEGSSGFSSQSANQSSLEMLQDMLAQVETELACLEPNELFGPSERPELQRGRGLTGFSVALVGTLGRMVSHLRRRDEEAQKEALVRRQMEEEMKEQRSLIDALTAECLTLREETADLKATVQERIPELEQRLDTVILAMGELGKDTHTQSQEEKAPSRALQPVPAERDREKPAPVSPAVLLSPPHQRDSRAPPTAHARSLNFESSHTPGSGSPGDSDGSRTPSSFASLPETVLPRPAPLMNQLSQHAVLEQIAEVTLQNAAIRAQLEHNHSHPTTQCSDRGALPVPGATPTKQQCVVMDDSSVRLMEDRLQELNRQSAAATAKLLELIEQQRQTTSHGTSPSVSPIPPHSTSPHTVVGRQTPEVCVSVPERAQPSHSRTNSGRSADAISPQNVDGRQKQSVNTQVDKLKGQGWFALSAHVRKLD